jgi:multimeric flavodoxin WrbA
MNLIIVQCSPNEDGLTAACASAAAQGARQAGASVTEVLLNDLQVGMCQACDRGWGECQSAHECQVDDGFQALHQQIIAADALVLVTPVYWGEMSESAKALTDRLRRCEATRDRAQGGSKMTGKPFIAVAAAGGSGNGTMTCLGSMERWGQHVGARVFDLIPVNRWTKNYKLDCICAAACELVESSTRSQTEESR